MVDGALLATGKVGGTVSPETAYDCARACALNAIAAIDALVGVDAVVRVVKVVGFVASDPSFTGQPQVVNGASELLGQLFGEPHARSAVGVAALPLGAPVEVELIVEAR
jgi:enamine deaminase RidA (YjgF/YER057c/UK114 family)